jgi:tetrahydromethanopterin S-methyltransferase subunit B
MFLHTWVLSVSTPCVAQSCVYSLFLQVGSLQERIDALAEELEAAEMHSIKAC